MQEKEFTCICCPMGCDLKVTIDGKNITVVGNSCKRGENFGKEEVTEPKRMITTTIACKGKNNNLILLPVISTNTVPRTKFLEVIHKLQKTVVKSPIRMGDIIVENIMNTGVNIIASKTIE